MNSICDWIWENPASTHNYKYLEIPNLNYLKYYNSRREADACMKFAMILIAIYNLSTHQLLGE